MKQGKRLSVIVRVAILVPLPIFLPRPCPAQTTIDLPAVQDVFVNAADPDANKNGSAQLFVGLHSDPKLGTLLLRGLIGFNVKGTVPTGAELEKAVLRLYEYTHTPTGAPATLQLAVAPLTAAWDEKTATWKSQPAVASAPVVRAAPGISEGYKEWDVTQIVEDWLSGGMPDHGFGLRSSAETTLGGWGFRSRESTADPPRLRITYKVPTPPAPAFFRRGDSNDDGKADISDAIRILGFLFTGSARPPCMKAADSNDDGKVDISDAIGILGFLFLGSAPPRAPFGACGTDPTPDSLDCAAFTRCPGAGLIRSVALDKTSLCAGESVRVTVVAEHPDGGGKPVTVSINGKVGSVQHVQFAGAPGARRLLVVAGTREGLVDVRQVAVSVAGCGPEVRFPLVRARLSLYRPQTVEFVVLNAADLAQGPTKYVWEFGDGQMLETTVPAASHRYEPWKVARDEPFVTYQTMVTVKPAPGPDASARHSVTLVNHYAWSKERGSIHPPVEWDERVRRVRDLLIGKYTLTNLEDEPIALTARQIEGEYCDPLRDPVRFAPEEVRLRLRPTEIFESAVIVPAGMVPGDICRLAVRFTGQTDSGVPVSASLYYTVADSPFFRMPERDYDILRTLNSAAAGGLAPNPNRIGDEDLHRLAREGKIDLPLRGRIPAPEGAAGADIGDECTPGDQLREGLTCQATAEWTALRGFAANARKGELLLSPGCGVIRAMLQRVNPPQLYAHIGIMTKHNVEVTHSTTSEDRLEHYPAEDDPGGDPTDGFATHALRYQWPGAVTQAADDACRGEELEDAAGDRYIVGSFAWHPQLCDGEQNLVAPLVLKAPAGREAELTPVLQAAADEALEIVDAQGAHYRFYSYTDGEICTDDAFDGPDPEHRDATCCSVFIWEAFQRLGGVVLEGSPEERETVDDLTPDGLYFYDAEERAAAAAYLYDTIYDQALGEAEWLGVLFADAPDDIANQICNCFAFDDCGQDALDSTAWESPGTARTASPDDILGWDEVYGRTEELVFRQTQWVRVFRVGASAGTGTIEGRVLGPDGAPVEGATVELVTMPEVPVARTDGQGEFRFDAIPSGSHALRATQLRGQLLYESCPGGVESPDEDCGLAEVQRGQTAFEDLTLEPPPRNTRRATMVCRGTIVDDETGVPDEVRDRDFVVEAVVSPLEREAAADFEPRCAGGEVRVVFHFRVTLLADDLSVRVEVNSELFEGTGCDTEDLEDTHSVQTDIFEDEGAQVGVNLDNSGPGGGDSADFLIDIYNDPAG
jgi:hypothetical protein